VPNQEGRDGQGKDRVRDAAALPPCLAINWTERAD
jgi:hypothetical protein